MYQLVENFKGGLDVRRPAVAGDPGTLQVGTNVVISRGGDVEVRKKFVATYDLSGAASAGLTFGYLVAGSTRYVFGSDASVTVPSGLTYQRLSHPDAGIAMTAVLDAESFDGKAYVIAEFEDGSVHHFYDGAIVTDWNDGRVREAMTSTDAIAEHLKTVINAGQSAVTATRSGSVITLTGESDGTAFQLRTETTNATGGVNDQTATVATVTTAVAEVAEVPATARFTVTGGTSNPGTNDIDAIVVDGVDILGAAVDWTTSHSATAQAIADQINAYTSTPDYTATASGPVVTISTVSGASTSINGETLTVTIAAGNVTVGSIVAFSGAVAAVSGVAQVSTVTIGGTPEVGDTFTIHIDETPYGAFSRPTVKGRTAMTYDSKLYSCAESLLTFSGVNDPTVWSSVNEDVPGAGSANMSSQNDGSETLTGTGIFQDNLAIFSRSNIQLWNVDPDPDLNAYLRTVQNTGTRSPRSIESYGNADTFYLSDTGVRSIRPRTNTDTAAVDDIGSPIDTEVVAYMRTLTDTQIESAAAAIDPETGRFLLSLGSRIYVFSYFPNARVSAWSRWEISAAEGSDNEVQWWAVQDGRLWCRAGDTIYLYGGADNDTYPGDDEVTATVRPPFLDGKKPGHVKELKRLDAAVEGEWTVQVLLDPNDTTIRTTAARLWQTTWHNRDGIPKRGVSTHFAPEFVHTAAGPAKIINFGLHWGDYGTKTDVVT